MANGAPVLGWKGDGAVDIAGPVSISGMSVDIPDTANAEVSYGSPSVISPSLTCAGDVVSKGGGFFVLSDPRSKRDVRARDPREDLALAMTMEPVSFTHHGSTRRQVGLIASDVGNCLPEAVGTGQAVVKDIMQKVVLRKVCTCTYAFDETLPGVSDATPVEVVQAGRSSVAMCSPGLITGPYGEGGEVFVVGRWLADALSLSWPAVAAVTLNAVRALAEQVDRLSQASA
ncbi:MAG: tail fiber domain-containing protein [Deltaproteobacteria bacterium]|nr:MAG: tail fiber domain-containing protein [Deltaproteobacteria bacterium]